MKLDVLVSLQGFGLSMVNNEWRKEILYMAISRCVVLANRCGDGGGEHWLVRMEWRPAGLSVCLPLLIFPCTIKSRSSLLAPAHPGGAGKMAVKWLWCGGGGGK